MKTTNYLAAIIFIVALFYPFKINQQSLSKSEDLKMSYDEALSNAVDDAAKQLIKATNADSMNILSDGKKVDYKKMPLNLDVALDQFYKSLYINLNISDNYAEQQALRDKIPVKIVAGYDGYYLNVWLENKVDGKMKFDEKWLNKKPYIMIDKNNNLKILFTLDDYVYVENLSNGQKYEGYENTLKSIFPNSIFGDKFDQVKSQVINQLIKKDLDYYTYYSNNIAKKYGFSLNFNIPYWGDRAITDISFIAFMQGQVINTGLPYDTYGFSSAKIREKRSYYGYERNGIKYYSSEINGTNPVNFFDEIECAKNGYMPDPLYIK